ncbi:NERD domain-containing protein [Candidatus Binatia bacterium]|nr:NERD domain-containing protein [Candidatus Binatia bacterium]
MSTTNRRRWTHKEAAEFQGKYSEMMLQTELRRLQGTKINGRIASENMAIDGRHFEVDYVVLVPRVGLVICEAKSFGGRIVASSHGQWRRGSSRENFFRNPCIQVLRTRDLYQRMLAASGIDRWPVIPLVVMTTRGVSLIVDRANPPQTDVIRLD